MFKANVKKKKRKILTNFKYNFNASTSVAIEVLDGCIYCEMYENFVTSYTLLDWKNI